MHRALGVAFGFVATAVVTAGLVIWWALEWSGVAVIETRDPEGGWRATRVWYAEPDGALWLEAGTPENPWYRDVLRDPTLRFTAGGRTTPYRAEPIPGEPARRRIRALLREKYGVRDRVVGLLIDTSGSVAVRLHPREAAFTQTPRGADRRPATPTNARRKDRMGP